MKDFKKGGPLQNSNIFATNRLFVKNPLFKKKKKKRAPGVYNPKGKFKYEDGGEKGCPPGQYWDGKKCVDDPFTKGLISQIKKGNESKKPIPSLTRKAPTQPTTDAFTNKPLLNKEIQQKRKRNSDLQKTFPEVEIIGKRPMGTIHGEIPDSFTENLVEFADPSGYFSWDDANQAYQNWQGSDNMLPSMGQAADMFGAVPMLGKLGKLKYLSHPAGAMKSAYKYFPWQQAVNFFDTAEDIDTDNLNQKKNGGSIMDLTEEEIQKYIDGGYVVEEVNDPSIPALTKAAKGGASKGCKDGEYWDGTKCTKLITLKNDKKYIDGVANWAMHVSDPNKISGDYNDQIKDRLYSGKWGLDPQTGALVKLSAVLPKSVTTVDAKTKASREKEKLAEKNYRAEEENKKAYEQSIIGAGFDPTTFGKAKGVNTITGEPIYASSKEEAERINQEAIDQFAIEGHAAVVNNPVFKTAANFTPVGMAVGAIEGLARFIPDAYTLAQNPSWAAAGQLGMDALQAAPVIGKPLATATGKALDYVKNMEPVAPGPMMLLGRTGSTNMVKKNMNYYKQLLDSYDGKKMSASNRKFYNDLIESGKKQDGMLTEAQLRELDRLKNSNFDFGKRGYNKESLSQVEPKAPTQNVIGATPEERLNEMYRRFSLPETKNKEAQEVFSNFKQRIESPEGKKRLKQLGIKSDDLLQKIKVVEDEFSYGYYSPNDNMIALNPGDPLIKNTMRHEIEHAVQNAIEKDYGSMSDIFKNLFKKGTLVPNQAKGISEIDDILSKLELRKTPTPNKQWTGNVIGDKPVDVSEYKPALKKRQNATDYFTSGSEGKEKSAFLGEVQQYMMDKGIIPKNSYVEITPKMVEETFIDAIGDEAGGGSYLRLFDIMKPTEKNYKTVAKGLNKMLVAVPTAGAVGTATMLANPFQGSDGLQQQKRGGATDEYIELDIPEKEIQWYIDNGYRVEPVTKLKKFIG